MTNTAPKVFTFSVSENGELNYTLKEHDSNGAEVVHEERFPWDAKHDLILAFEACDADFRTTEVLDAILNAVTEAILMEEERISREAE